MEPDILYNHVPKHQPEGLVNGCSFKEKFGGNVSQIKVTDQVKALQTLLRDSRTTRGDFIFYADRLIRMVVEEALNMLPFNKATVTTPTGCQYEGVKYIKGVTCGVSIVRSGEAMEQGLRDCCRSIRIGKILIQSLPDTGEARVSYAKFPADIQRRKVLLMYPIIDTGQTLINAVDVLKEHGVDTENVLLLTLFCTPKGLDAVIKAHPSLTILTTEVHECVPSEFGTKYFGTS